MEAITAHREREAGTPTLFVGEPTGGSASGWLSSSHTGAGARNGGRRSGAPRGQRSKGAIGRPGGLPGVAQAGVVQGAVFKEYESPNCLLGYSIPGSARNLMLTLVSV